MPAVLRSRPCWRRCCKHARPLSGGPWSHPQEPTGEEWWADVPPDRGRGADLSRECVNYDLRTRPASCRLRDEPRNTILVACSKCDWKAAFDRGEMITTHGSNIGMVELLRMLAAPGCSKVGHHWDHCGAYDVSPIDAVIMSAWPDSRPGYGAAPTHHARSHCPRRHCSDRLRAWGYGVARLDAVEPAVNSRERTF